MNESQIQNLIKQPNDWGFLIIRLLFLCQSLYLDYVQ